MKSPVYLAINEDGSPLLEGDTLVVFERAEDADMAASYLGEHAGVVVTSPQQVVQRPKRRACSAWHSCPAEPVSPRSRP